MRLAPLLALASLLATGCQNSCQQICGRMADYARECGYDVTSADVQACRDAQAGDASSEDRQVCRQQGGAADIRENFTCDDLAPYFPESQRAATPMRQSFDDSDWETGDTAW